MADDGLSAGAVARRLGVAVTTLRTWHQRYGLGPSSHVPGHHRRYTAEDLSRLEVMRRLTGEGIAPAEAARWARYAPDVPPTEPQPARDGGGFAIPVGRAGPTARGLARAAIRLDVDAMRDIMSRAITDQGVVSAWDDVLRPVLAGIGERHMASKRLIEVEHLFSRTATEVFAAVPRPRGAEPPRILLACADEEQHSLPLEALAAALAIDGVPSRLFGARLPSVALADAVDRTGPDVVMIWSHAPDTADPAQLVALQDAPRRPALILAGGPGWSVDSLPTGVVAPANLAEALQLAGTWARRSLG